ncbi:Mediator of RNA polymerase II transcription subunit 7 [Umbelopsis nana]
MTEQKKSGSAWPEPPAFYLRYTNENLEQARLLKHKKVDPADVRLDFPVELLEPPPPIEGSYVVFDQHWQTDDRLLSLEEMNVKQLYPSGKIDRVYELKKEPNKFGDRIEDISNILINIHHILNEYRPHQARETLRLMMETQLKKKVLATAELKRRRDEARGMLQTLKDEVNTNLSTSAEREGDEDISMGEPSPAAANAPSTQSVSLISTKLLELVDSME